MRFDLVIGNPPYQAKTLGGNKGFAPPVYHRFMDDAYEVGDRVILIHPARCLFNAGSTPKDWNRKLLSDPHFKVLFFEQNASALFSNTEIKGGVVISCHDREEEFGPIDVFTPFDELSSILKKAAPAPGTAESLMEDIYVQNKFDLDALYAEHPSLKAVIGSGGTDKRFRNNAFDMLPVFTEQATSDSDIAVIGVVKNKRVWRYLPERFFDTSHGNLFKWKVLVARVNGAGILGEVLSTPLVAGPRTAYTQTFIGIGAFDTRGEAENCLKYVKTRFMRVMLGILKITQDNNRETWRLVPRQDFTGDSDIDWSKPIPDIDRQLYSKYGLSRDEADFIEKQAREMK